DPNFGRRVRNRRQLNSLQNTWPYGYSMPIAVRYTQDAFSRSGWLWPVDAKGEPLKATSYMAVGFYVAKYVNKKSDMDLAAKGLGAKEWNNSLKTKLSLLPKKLFRIRMSRNFGMKMLTMTNLSTECLIQLTKLGYDATPFNQILKLNAKREMRLRLGKVTVADVLAAQPVTTNLLKFMRASIKMIGVSNLQSFIASMTQKLTLSDISDESKNYLDKAGITTACLRIKSKCHAAFLGTINPDTNKIPKHLFQGYLNIYNNYFKAPWMPDRTEANPNELNQDDARYGFRCCHLKNIWTAPLPPETELSRQMTTSTTSIDIMGLQAAYANLHTDQERDYFMQRYHDVISSFGGKTSYDADNRPLLVMRSNLWASGYDVDGTDQTSLGQFSGRVQQTYKHSVPRFFVPEHGTMFTLALVRFPPT